MGYTANGIVISRNVGDVFSIVNNIENWPRLMGYKAVELLERLKLSEHRELIKFRITNVENEDGKEIEESWVSHRIIDRAEYSARGVREAPMFPFLWWILDIKFETEGDNETKMTWIQDFSIDPATGHTDEEIVGYINKGSKEELLKIKHMIESGLVN